jgi:hypothetical protein
MIITIITMIMVTVAITIMVMHTSTPISGRSE